MLRLLISGIVGVCCVLLLASRTDAQSEEVVARFEARVHQPPSGNSLPYRLLKPATYDPARKYPLVVFYHGAGERGEDNRQQLIHGMALISSSEGQAQFPCFLAVPQCPADEQWVATPWTALDHRMPAEPSGAMQNSLDLITSLEREFSIDADRIYLTGLSMGGFGVWDALQRQPRRFAAAVPICGGGDKQLAPSIAHVPVWCFHGGADTVVQPVRSRDMVEALRAAGGTPRYTEYENVGHNSWAPTYANAEVFRWLFEQHR